jgi:hypothetical protein
MDNNSLSIITHSFPLFYCFLSSSLILSPQHCSYRNIANVLTLNVSFIIIYITYKVYYQQVRTASDNDAFFKSTVLRLCFVFTTSQQQHALQMYCASELQHIKTIMESLKRDNMDILNKHHENYRKPNQTKPSTFLYSTL